MAGADVQKSGSEQVGQPKEGAQPFSFEAFIPRAKGDQLAIVQAILDDPAKVKGLLDEEYKRRFNQHILKLDTLNPEAQQKALDSIHPGEVGQERYEALKAYIQPAPKPESQPLSKENQKALEESIAREKEMSRIKKEMAEQATVKVSAEVSPTTGAVAPPASAESAPSPVASSPTLGEVTAPAELKKKEVDVKPDAAASERIKDKLKRFDDLSEPEKEELQRDIDAALEYAVSLIDIEDSPIPQYARDLARILHGEEINMSQKIYDTLTGDPDPYIEMTTKSEPGKLHNMYLKDLYSRKVYYDSKSDQLRFIIGNINSSLIKYDTSITFSPSIDDRDSVLVSCSAPIVPDAPGVVTLFNDEHLRQAQLDPNYSKLAESNGDKRHSVIINTKKGTIKELDPLGQWVSSPYTASTSEIGTPAQAAVEMPPPKPAEAAAPQVEKVKPDAAGIERMRNKLEKFRQLSEQDKQALIGDINASVEYALSFTDRESAKMPALTGDLQRILQDSDTTIFYESTDDQSGVITFVEMKKDPDHDQKFSPYLQPLYTRRIYFNPRTGQTSIVTKSPSTGTLRVESRVGFTKGDDQKDEIEILAAGQYVPSDPTAVYAGERDYLARALKDPNYVKLLPFDNTRTEAIRINPTKGKVARISTMGNWIESPL